MKQLANNPVIVTILLNGSTGEARLRHVHPDSFVEENSISRSSPVDELEPEIENHEAYREASRKMMRVMNAGLSHIQSSFLKRGATLNEVVIAFYQFAFAIGSNICEDKTMTELGIAWGSGDESRAAVSKGATTFCRGLNIQPSFYMKKEPAALQYQRARIESIKCNGKSKAA